MNPVLIIELKWNKSDTEAVKQILDRHYQEALEKYSGNILLIGINYDSKTHVHSCKIKKL